MVWRRKIPSSKSKRARLARVKDISKELGLRLHLREVRTVLDTIAGRDINPALVKEEISKLQAFKAAGIRNKRAIDRLNSIARSDFRIMGQFWEARVHINIARTGIRFWLRVQEVQVSDRELLSRDKPENPELRELAGRLRHATRAAADPIRQRCITLDQLAADAALEEDLVYVKSAIRQLEFPTTTGPAIMALIEDAHSHALARSIALGELAKNPHDITSIVGLARQRPKRKILALVGPTNSGKTHRALQILRSASRGAYLAPLRLMAMEGYDRLKSFGICSDMMTGEECIKTAGATHVSATIEMADIETSYEVAVIDEAQMLDDPQRGWAWTRAIFHMDASTVIVTGSPDCLPILRRIAFLTGESIQIETFERRASLAALTNTIELGSLRPNDAVIAFSRANVLALKAEISRIQNPLTGKPFRVSTIYGALGPEVRRSEAARFAKGETEILVATDAIGMGLNLPIDRVIFSTLTKFDGNLVRDLQESEIRQIGGRAGRSGQQDGGFVGLLSTSSGNTGAIKQALSRLPPPCTDPRPYIWPTSVQIDKGMKALGLDILSKALPAISAVLRQGPDYRCQIDTSTIDLLQTIEPFGLSLEENHSWIGCPINLRTGNNREVVKSWASHMQIKAPIRAPYLDFQPDQEIDDHQLQEIESIVAQAGAYLWMSGRWPDLFEDKKIAFLTRRDGNRMIEEALKQRHIHRTCQECGKPISFRVRHTTCHTCWSDSQHPRQTHRCSPKNNILPGAQSHGSV